MLHMPAFTDMERSISGTHSWRHFCTQAFVHLLIPHTKYCILVEGEPGAFVPVRSVVSTARGIYFTNEFGIRDKELFRPNASELSFWVCKREEIDADAFLPADFRHYSTHHT